MIAGSQPAPIVFQETTRICSAAPVGPSGLSRRAIPVLRRRHIVQGVLLPDDHVVALQDAVPVGPDYAHVDVVLYPLPWVLHCFAECVDGKSTGCRLAASSRAHSLLNQWLGQSARSSEIF